MEVVSDISNVFFDVVALTKKISLSKNTGETVVLTNGCFDILHIGHVRYLQDAADQGDKLVVALNSDDSVKLLKGDNRPIVPLQERMELLASLRCVDWVIPFYEETPLNIISALKPDILVKGGDYTIDQIVGADFVLNNGGEVLSLPFWDGFSTSNIIEKISKLEK